MHIHFPVTLLHITLWNRYLLSVHLGNENYEFLCLACHFPPSQMHKLSFHAFPNSKNSINRLSLKKQESLVSSAAVLLLSLKPVDLFSCFSLKDLEVP